MATQELARWILLVVFLLGVGISGFYRRRARRSGETIPRGMESPVLIAARLLLALPLLLAIVAFLIHPSWMDWSRLGLPSQARWIGAWLGLCTVPLIYWVMTSLGRNVSETVLTKRDHQLVSHGPYRWIRHPLYSSGLLLLTSAALLMDNWFVATLTALVALAIRLYVIPVEEAALLAKFGDDYRQYRAGTGALIPRIVPR